MRPDEVLCAREVLSESGQLVLRIELGPGVNPDATLAQGDRLTFEYNDGMSRVELRYLNTDQSWIHTLEAERDSLKVEKAHLWEVLTATRKEADELAAEVARLQHMLKHPEDYTMGRD